VHGSREDGWILDMPWTFDPVTRGDEVVAAVHQLIADGGVSAVTYRSVGAAVGIAASSLHDNYPDRAHLFKVATYRLARSRALYFDARVPVDGLAAMVPTSETDLRQARVWLALRAFARTQPLVAVEFDQARSTELHVIALALERRPADPVCSAILCLLEGLESARTTGEQPMSHETAQAVLALVLAALHDAPPGSASGVAA
jgi:AcrR family transcriptional regulator